jgi:hypothetical protein
MTALITALLKMGLKGSEMVKIMTRHGYKVSIDE